ncbi:hypothetical protein GCM10027435_02870 [Haloparvum alkalitolerans]|uniref:DUF4350 domain-containing protein n=1 Tax=Haloparvum alkalitolerans TaxID=1042953 RepID=UPI003CF11E73
MASPWPDLPRTVLALLTAAVVVALILAASTSTVAFGSYNPSWEGTSDLRELDTDGTETEVLLDTEGYAAAAPNATVAFVIAPAEGYSQADVERIETFLANGGTLVVADNFGAHGNALLDDLGASARLDGDILRDERHYGENPRFPVATNVSDDPELAAVDQLTLNHGTAVEPGNATVLVRTSEFAYLDRNRNDELDANETLAAHAVVARESMGEGQVITVGDPSLFINAMLDAPDNRAFATALLNGHDAALLDYSHAGSQPPLAVALQTLRATPGLQVLLGLVGLLAVGTAFSGRSHWSAVVHAVGTRFTRVGTYFGLTTRPDETQRTDPEALKTYLREQHPEWDEERLDHVMAGTLGETDAAEANE